MKTQAKLIITSILLITFLIVSCKEHNKKTGNALTEHSYLKELVERQIEESNYYISIPKEYKIKTTNGPDFSVYYFYPIDTTIKAKFSGGLYFGNHPSKFPPDSDNCKVGNLKSKILNENAEWTISNCKEEYSIQTIIDSKSREGYNEFIHAFGNAKSKTDLDKLLSIFNTMKKKK